MAMGGDQGGSIRIPAAACGIVGLKPTYGLVPYTGIIPVHTCLDHTGPMARTVKDVALLLEVNQKLPSSNILANILVRNFFMLVLEVSVLVFNYKKPFP